MPRNITTTDCQELLNQATMYYEGIGVEQSVRKAFTLFEQIAKVTGPETKKIVEKYCQNKLEKKSLDWLLRYAD